MGALGIVLCVIFIITPSTFGKTNPNDELNLSEDPNKDGYKDMFKTRKIQSSQLAETNLFASEVDSECLRRALCALGTTEDTAEWPNLSLASGLQYLYNILKQMVEEVQTVDPYAKENFPRLHQAVASYQLGKSTKDENFCDTLFTCPTPSTELLSQVGKEASVEDFEKAESRSNCIASKKLCPGISIGCSLCGLFSPGTCGDQCIVAGVYCGVSAFACKAEQLQSKFRNRNKKKKIPPKPKMWGAAAVGRS